MEIVKAILPIAQVIIAIAVVTAILLQRNDAALGGVFGGSESVAHTKRGLERGLFITTVVLAALFVITSILSLLFQSTV